MTSFIPANAPNDTNPRMLPVFSAGYVICGENVLPNRAALDPCVQKATQSGFSRAFLKDVVVIGEESEKLADVHNTVIGPVAGAVLVANYIESILGPDRLFHAAWPAANVVFGLAVYAGFLWIIDSNKPFRVKLLWIVALFVAAFAAIIGVFAVSRIYLEPVTLSLLAIVIRLFKPIPDTLIKGSRR
jgi:CHASE2 domain-containing sensor protein